MESRDATANLSKPPSRRKRQLASSKQSFSQAPDRTVSGMKELEEGDITMNPHLHQGPSPPAPPPGGAGTGITVDKRTQPRMKPSIIVLLSGNRERRFFASVCNFIYSTPL